MYSPHILYQHLGKGGGLLKRYLQKKSFKLLCVVAGVLFALAIYTMLTGGGFVLRNLLGFAATPMQRVSAVAANNAANTAANLTRSYDDLLAENQSLRNEVNELNQKLADYYQVRQENDSFRNYLELKREHRDYQLVAGYVVGRDPNDVFCSFRVDQGSLSGVHVNDPVITEAGLVGWVSSVSSMYCNVTTILSADTNLSAQDMVSRDSGVLQSDLALADQGLVRLGLLEADNKIQVGDMIVTSGLGGRFPKGLLIGKALEVKNSTTDVSLYATVQPFVDMKDVKDVLIITDFQGKGEALSAVTPPGTPAAPSGSAGSQASSSPEVSSTPSGGTQ